MFLNVGLLRAPIETTMTPCLYAQAACSVRVSHFMLSGSTYWPNHDHLSICAGCGFGACFSFYAYRGHPLRRLCPVVYMCRLHAWCVCPILCFAGAPIDSTMTPCLYAQAADLVRVSYFRVTGSPIHPTMTLCIYAQAADFVRVSYLLSPGPPVTPIRSPFWNQWNS